MAKRPELEQVMEAVLRTQSPEVQAKVAECKAKIMKVVDVYGEEGKLALALASAEVQP